MISCSIIIPTYNRPDYLKRILGYYSDYEGTYNIIVADSSSDENKIENGQTISSFPDLDISYISNYSDQINPWYKLADAVNHVKSKYCLFCADDDLITPNGISQSVDFLENNPDFTVAHGRYIWFWLESDEMGKRFCWQPSYLPLSITFPDPEKRLTHHLSSYFIATFYAVHRTDFCRMIFEETLKFTNDGRFGEFLPSMLALVYGKMKCLDVLYAARETILTSASATSATLSDFIRDGTYEEKYKRFRECLSTHLSQQCPLNIEESKKMVDNAMSAYMKKKYTRDYKHMLLTKMNDILGYLKLPDLIDNRIRRLYRKLFTPGYMCDFPISMDVSPSWKYYDDFNRIRLHVLSYAKISTE